MKLPVSVVAVLVCLCSSLAARAAESETAHVPTQVFVGTYVVETRNVDARGQTFYADLYLWLRFATVDADKVAQIIDKLEPVNGKFDSRDVTDRKEVNGQTYVCFRVTGTFFFHPDLKLYPFDVQTLPIMLENSTLASDEVVFFDDKDSYARSGEPETWWGVNRNIRIPEYKLSGVKRTAFEATYPTNFGDPDRMNLKEQASRYSRFVVELRFARDWFSYAFKILIPLLIILSMAYLVFFLPPARIDVSAPVAMTALLSCMAFNVAVTQAMPDVGYLVLSDKFFIATLMLLLLTLVETFMGFILDHTGKAEIALKTRKRARFLFPALVVLIFVFFVTTLF